MNELCDKTVCTGCSACAAACPKQCIEMSEDEFGFLHPSIDTKNCIRCGMCAKACPIENPTSKGTVEVKAYSAFSNDEKMRMDSSSGGIFTELAREIFTRGGVVYGAAYNEKFEVVHQYAQNEGELSALRGAKYAQSDLRSIFPQVKKHLTEGNHVLFFGTPCQVAGLKSFLKKDYDTLLTVDCVCHSVPSPMAWREYVKYRAQSDNSGNYPKQINLRSKITGWSSPGYSNLFTYESGKASALRPHESVFMNLFIKGYICRKSCETCQFKGYERVSDLTLGDFWGIASILPEMDDNKGTSVVLVQSDKGRRALECIKDRLVMMPVSLSDASKYNPAILKPFPAHEKKEEAFGLIKNGKIAECEKWFKMPKKSIISRAKNVVKRLLRKLKSNA